MAMPVTISLLVLGASTAATTSATDASNGATAAARVVARYFARCVACGVWRVACGVWRVACGGSAATTTYHWKWYYRPLPFNFTPQQPFEERRHTEAHHERALPSRLAVRVCVLPRLQTW
jgi:hypothetical protein